MIYGLYQSAAGMMTNEYRQGVIANNLANADTPGFKRDIAVFSERQRADEAGLRGNPSSDLLGALSGGVWLGQTETDFSQAGMTRSENPLDVAIEGRGFFVVERDGKPLLTRDGRFVMDVEGRLVSAADGAGVLGPGGAPILLNPQGGEPSVSEDGRIMQRGATVGQLAVVGVDDPRALAKAGGGRFIAPSERLSEADARLMSGFVESSGVPAVPTMVGMIESARAYEINARMVSLQDETLGRLINEVARV